MTGQQITAPEAKELTAEEAQARSEEMYKLDQRIKRGFAKGREALWEVAEALHLFDEASGWTALSYERRSDWLADPEVSMTTRTYQRLISSYRETVLLREVPFEEVKQLDASKVDIVLGKVKTGEVPIEKALADAATLGARDLREEYYDRPEPKPTPPPSGDNGTANVGAPPINPPDDTPVSAATGEPVTDEPTDDPVDPPMPVDDVGGDPTGRVEPLDPEFAGSDATDGVDGEADDGELDGLDAEAEAILEGTATEPAQNSPPANSGQVLDSFRTESAEVLEWIQMGLDASSEVMRRQALEKAQAFIAKVFS